MARFKKKSIIIVCLIFLSGCIPFFPKSGNKISAEDKTTTAIAHYERGLALELNGKPEEALIAFNQANESSPRPAAYYHLGLIYAAKADYSTAITNLQKALELVPTYEAAKQELNRIKDLKR